MLRGATQISCTCARCYKFALQEGFHVPTSRLRTLDARPKMLRRVPVLAPPPRVMPAISRALRSSPPVGLLFYPTAGQRSGSCLELPIAERSQYPKSQSRNAALLNRNHATHAGGPVPGSLLQNYTSVGSSTYQHGNAYETCAVYNLREACKKKEATLGDPKVLRP